MGSPAANPEVDPCFSEATRWREEALALRHLLLEAGLTEELKWGKPCYSAHGGNICIVQRMTEFLALLFFKGALLSDPDGLLERQGPNSHSGYRMTFTSTKEIADRADAIAKFVREAIAVQKSGLSVDAPPPVSRPDELRQAFAQDPKFEVAFERLTPGRQRGWLMHFSSAKQPKTRCARVERAKASILAGRGPNDR